MNKINWNAIKTQKEWCQTISYVITHDMNALRRAILLVYNSQTREEKQQNVVLESNKVGFNSWDVVKMSKIAKKVKNNKNLTEEEISLAKTIMPKYWRQIMNVSKENLKKQKENEAKYEEEIAYQIDLKHQKQSLESARDEEINKCVFEGKSCSFGICDECPYNIYNNKL